MKKTQIENLRKWFHNYVPLFLGCGEYIDGNVRLKENHTMDVCSHCTGIARSIDLTSEEIFLAEAVGLFHDVGRFEQLKKYGTLNDKKSENHGELGVKVLKKENTLAGIDEEEQMIIMDGAEFHSNKDLPGDKDEKTLLFLRIVRDADKLAILEQLAEYYNSAYNGTNPALDLDFDDTPGVSPEVMADIMHNRSVDRRHVNNVNDFKLLQAGWVFDLNFDYSREFLREKGFIQKIVNTIQPCPEVVQASEHINRHLMVPRN